MSMCGKAMISSAAGLFCGPGGLVLLVWISNLHTFPPPPPPPHFLRACRPQLQQSCGDLGSHHGNGARRRQRGEGEAVAGMG